MPSFLLIDDDASVLKLAARMLTGAFPGARILKANTGREGLELVKSELPDVVILDVVMPDLSGLDVCRAIKSDPATAYIPVIMMTGAHTDARHKISGLDTGADSYLPKPFEQDELAAQVNASLRVKQSEDLLRKQKRRLEQAFRRQTEELRQSREALAQKVTALENLVERQTQELIRADRLAGMGILAAGIAHEVNNPNTFIVSNLQTFRLFWEFIAKVIDRPDQCTATEKQRLAFIRQEMPGLIKGMEEGSRRISAIVTGMKNYLAGNQVENRVVNLKEVVDAALRLVWNQIKHDVEIKTEFIPDLAPVFGSEQLLCQVFVNLIANAAHAVKEHRGEGRIVVSGFSEDDFSVVTVQDDGPGMNRESLRNLFNPFFTTRRGHGGTGLGLFVSHGIIKGHNGFIEVESEPGHGTVFRIKLPAIAREDTLAVELEPAAES